MRKKNGMSVLTMNPIDQRKVIWQTLMKNYFQGINTKLILKKNLNYLVSFIVY
jgi:hypothetical protein